MSGPFSDFHTLPPLPVRCRHLKRKWRWLLLVVALLVLLGTSYRRTHPLVFMETHAHCIACAGMALSQYASDHGGCFPSHPRGYGNALLLLDEVYYSSLTGPGYDVAPMLEAKRAGTDLPEEACGRVYIQGLTERSYFEIAILFDKLPTPGGDHCHFPGKVWAPLGREVLFRNGTHTFVRETDWPAFASNQVELLIAEGFERQEAERLFGTKPSGK